MFKTISLPIGINKKGDIVFMADEILARSPMADIEARMGIVPVEELLAERRRLVEQVAELRARHGSFGTFDAERKSKLATIKMMLRARAARDQIKKTEMALEDEAHAHPDYVEFVAAATMERARLTKVEALIDSIDATIQRANAVARYLTAEAHL